MKKMFLVAVMCGVMMLAACGGGGGGDNGATTYTPSVYVAGSVSTGTGSNACYWKDGVRVDLENDDKSSAYDIAISNGNIYVAGKYNNGYCYWVNGVRYDLNSAGSGYFARVKVIGGIVYISGKSSNGEACVWINGTISEVGNSDSYAYGMEIINDTIYMVGGIGEGGGHAAIWTKSVNGGTWTMTNLHPTSGYEYSDAYSIAVHNGTFYIAGYLYNNYPYPALWTGNALNSLSYTALPIPEKDTDVNGYTYSIQIYNGQPYIAGHYNIDNSGKYSRAALWIGSNDPILYAPEDGDDSAAFGVFIHNGDVYVAGQIKKPKTTNSSEQYIQPCYWKNGVRVDLPVPAERGSSIPDDTISANAILVQ